MGGESDTSPYLIHARGLPWSCTEDEILKFFDPIEVKGGCDGIHITRSREGRPNGEAFIEFQSSEDVAEAEKKHNQHIGRRYIEVFPASSNQMEWAVKREFTGSDDEDDCCVRLRGLPYNCSKEEICQFFSGIEIVPNGIAMATDLQGRTTGEAFVQFVSKDMAEKAQEKHKEKIGHRYIEIFSSNLEQIRAAMSGRGGMRGGGSDNGAPFIGPQGPGGNFGGGPPFNGGGGSMGGGGFGNRSSPYDSRDRMGGPNRFNRGGGFNNFGGDNMGGGYGGRGGRGGPRGSRPRYPTHSVHMRGLPFKASDYDIMEFFKPLETTNITLGTDNNGRASGEADVEFGSHEDAVKAMDKHKEHMKHRYIELFLNSSPKEEEFRGGRFDMDNMGGGDMMGGPGGMMGGGSGNMMGGGPGMMGGGGFGGNMDNMNSWGQGGMGAWQQQGGMGSWGPGGGNMGGGGGNMGGGGGNMAWGSGMGGPGGNMGSGGGMTGGMGMGGGMGNMGMGGGMGGGNGMGMGGGMGGGGGGLGGGMGGGNMGGSVGGGLGFGGGLGALGSGGGLGRSLGGPKGDSYVGKIKPTGRTGSWSTDRDRKSAYGIGRSYGVPDAKKEMKSSVIESRGGDYGVGGGIGADYGEKTDNFSSGGYGGGVMAKSSGGGGYGGGTGATSYGGRGSEYGAGVGASSGLGGAFDSGYGGGAGERGVAAGSGGASGGSYGGGSWMSGGAGGDGGSSAAGYGDYQGRASNYSSYS